EHGLFERRKRAVEQAAELTDVAADSRGERRPHEALYPFERAVPRVDVDSGVAIGQPIRVAHPAPGSIARALGSKARQHITPAVAPSPAAGGRVECYTRRPRRRKARARLHFLEATGSPVATWLARREESPSAEVTAKLKRIVLLGSTGSVGRSSLEVV